ncbi:hypothetical protein AVEN_29243-1 [Araneus ventricosus]|uniref:Uncharacterized protein n=1 Tax=Araneus ventricosus TaxID=182803 RepID=A0A4Y2DZJ8_ARAVE|nr:hypothetical protein AVEN_29243-1 [Araneus ventricosus]
MPMFQCSTSVGGLRSLPLTSDHLPMFLLNVGTTHKPSSNPQTTGTGQLVCAKSSRNTHLDFFYWFRKPPERLNGLHSFCAKRVRFL